MDVPRLRRFAAMGAAIAWLAAAPPPAAGAVTAGGVERLDADTIFFLDTSGNVTNNLTVSRTDTGAFRLSDTAGTVVPVSNFAPDCFAVGQAAECPAGPN